MTAERRAVSSAVACLLVALATPGARAAPARDAARLAQYRDESSRRPELDAVREQLRRDDAARRSRVERMSAAHDQEMARRQEASGAAPPSTPPQAPSASTSPASSEGDDPTNASPRSASPATTGKGDAGGLSALFWGSLAVVGLLALVIAWVLARSGRKRAS